ncbi:methyl-accepting chemotaxis protein [Paenibacillus septentrionalis]|uniref:Methyl-accepting chemotaxis protein n=1 Tax=Paenibacillus septentrionalis TaxID=429342 RepID=A0ABW1V1M7_9BACL
MSWYNNLKTSTKLISAFLIMAMMVATVGIYGLFSLDKMNNSAHRMYTDVAVSTYNLQSAQVSYTNLRVAVRDLLTVSSQEEMDSVKERIEEHKANLISKIEDYRDGYLSEFEQQAIQTFDQTWSNYQVTLNRSLELADSDQNDALILLIKGDFTVVGNQLRDVIDNTVDAAMKFGDTSDQDNAALYKQVQLVTIIVIVLGVALSIGLGLIISLIISRPLGRVVELVKKVANGDLRENTEISRKDEIGQLAASVNLMVDNLRATIGNILLSAQSVSAASEQISASTQEIASGSTNQANDAQMISELFNELSTVIHSVAQNTEEASELSSKTVEVAKVGNSVITASMKSMGAVNEQMKKLESDSQKIGEITQVIEDIADQTNLLALNAAIEAARAGEQGRGFAVVADEVRKLAERSGEATKQITIIIKGMQENTKQSAGVVQESVDLSIKTGESFKEITEIVEITGQKVTEIAAASEQQAAQASTVLQSVESISAVTEETAASSEETALTAQSLAQLAEDLNKSVSIFRIN